MSNGNPLMNLFQPVAPGLSGAINPLVFIGSGMASGNVGGSLAQMAQIQQNAQQIAMQRSRQQAQMQAQQAQEAERMRMREQEAANRVLVENYFRAQGQYGPREQLIAKTVAPDAFAKSLITQADPTKELQLYQEMGGEAGTGMPFDQWYQESFKAPGGVTVQLGGEERGAVPQAMVRIDDPTSPTGTRLVPEPGSPVEAKREAEEQKRVRASEAEARKKMEPLQAMKDSLDRYRGLLRESGPEIMAGPAKSALQTAYIDLLMKKKEADNLGALTGPDLELMQGAMMDPTSLMAQVYEKTGNMDAFEAQLDQVQAGVDTAMARVTGGTPPQMAAPPPQPAVPAEAPASGEIARIANDEEYNALPPGTLFIGPDGLTRRK